MTRLIVFCMILLLMQSCKGIHSFKKVHLKKGRMNFTDMISLHTNPVRLDGEWEFYWNELLKPEDLVERLPTTYYTLPGSWNGF